MARPHIEPYVETDVPFRKMTLPGFRKGMRYKTLSIDRDTGACTLKLELESGYALPPGLSYTELELFILEGSIDWGARRCGPGHYFRVPAGVAMPALHAREGCRALVFYNYGEPSFVESDADHPRARREDLAIIDGYEGIPWQPADLFPAVASGCMIKILKWDELTHALTFLYFMSPKFRQDNISYHDCAEESYHIWGTSWMMQFGELPTGGYFWRPPWINHGAFRSELGCLAIGRTDSELHNYFHFNPWTTPEENRERAAARLLRRKPDLYRWVVAHGHNHPDDFEFPHYHIDEHGNVIEHAHPDGEGDHRHD